MNWETGKDIYTFSSVQFTMYKKITNENLLYNKGNSIQCSVVTKHGKIF